MAIGCPAATSRKLSFRCCISPNFCCSLYVATQRTFAYNYDNVTSDYDGLRLVQAGNLCASIMLALIFLGRTVFPLFLLGFAPLVAA